MRVKISSKRNKDETFSEVLVRYGQKYQADKASQITSLFGGDDMIDTTKPTVPKGEKWPEIVRLEKNVSLWHVFIGSSA